MNQTSTGQVISIFTLFGLLALSTNVAFGDYKAQTCYKVIQFRYKTFQVSATGYGPTTGVNVPGSSFSNCCSSVDEIISEQFENAIILNNGNCYPSHVLAVWERG